MKKFASVGTWMGHVSSYASWKREKITDMLWKEYLFEENYKEYTNIAGKQIISKSHEEKVLKSSYKELRSRKYDKRGKSSSLLQA